ncbi:hypothetical protein A0256_00760 [Mucilaginibacter sp. PAMC 26640]|nr:hypothetical protein A0256_00760 [Mucilaginibacter sp. PAMC 26640]
MPSYEPTKFNISGGLLKLTTNKGIDYATNNNQINLLGIKVAQRNKVVVEVSLKNPINGTQSQQAGVWFGLNDKYSLKLIVRAGKIELHREINDVSVSQTGTNTPDQRISPTISNLSTSTVRLRLTIDSLNQTAEGFYSMDGGVSYKNVAVGYLTTTISIAGMGLTDNPCYATIYATHRNATTASTYYFDDFKVYNPLQVVPAALTFSKDSLTYTVYEGGRADSLAVNLSAGAAAANVKFSTTAPWLKINPARIGTVMFGGSDINTMMSPGTYRAIVTATASNYQPATLVIRILIVDGVSTKPINMNFQDRNTVPPTGYNRDIGQPYAARTGLYQSSGLSYGWRRSSNSATVDISLNGFNRNTPEDLLNATLIYMQANNLTGTFSGTKVQSYWEIRVPNGIYDVTVGVGDGKPDTATEIDAINIEGMSAISGFVPSGIAGSITRFKQITRRVSVTDEHLTIDANGGTNTKIDFTQIVPVSIAPYIGMSATTLNLIIDSGSTAAKTFNLFLGNSANTSINYTTTVSYAAGATGWLAFVPNKTGEMPASSFDYSAGAKLPAGTYTATIKISAMGYTSTTASVQLRVVNGNHPYVISSSPANNAIMVDPGTVSIAANNLHVPVVAGFKGGVDNSTITGISVQLYSVRDGVSKLIPGVVQGTGGGDAISFSPSAALVPNTTYKFLITSAVKSYSGSSFSPFSMMFTTGDEVANPLNNLDVHFSKSAMPNTQNKKYTTLKFGPDGKLYALRLDGVIERFNVDHVTGLISNLQPINTLVTKYGERSAIGLAFTPESTATNLSCYVTHSSSGLVNSPMFDGNISKLTGADLETETLVVAKLPRSTRDHMANGLAFGPDGALYISQGSNSSAGAYDNDWQRAESLLAGCILRLDLSKLNGHELPLIVQTTSTQSIINAAPVSSSFMDDGTYNPYSTTSPLTIYASGVRNAYSLVWHSNGQLYIPTNGSGGGGNSPASVAGARRPDGSAYNGPTIQATTGVQVQNDWLFRVNPLKPVAYFGHPNPLRGEFVENRGYVDNPLYPVNIGADARYFGAAYNFGLNHSPNGAIEYKSNNFNGLLKNKLLICRFSGGGDLVVLKPGSMVKDPTVTIDNDHIYDITQVSTGSGNDGLVGMSGFVNPLNLVEDEVNGNLYVVEYNWNALPSFTSQITLLKAYDSNTNARVAALMNLSVSKDNNTEGLLSYKNNEGTIVNQGDAEIKIKSLKVIGADATIINIKGVPQPEVNNPLIIKKNSSLSFTLVAPANYNFKSPLKLRVTTVQDTIKEAPLNFYADDKGNASGELIGLINTNPTRRSLEPALIVYPNPNPGEQINIKLEHFKINEDVNLGVFDMVGNQIRSMKIQTDAEGSYMSKIAVPKTGPLQFFIIRAVAQSHVKEVKVICQ